MNTTVNDALRRLVLGHHDVDAQAALTRTHRVAGGGTSRMRAPHAHALPPAARHARPAAATAAAAAAADLAPPAERTALAEEMTGQRLESIHDVAATVLLSVARTANVLRVTRCVCVCVCVCVFYSYACLGFSRRFACAASC